jgi:hypothetical protein
MVGGRYIFFDIVSYSSQLKSDSETVHFLWPAAVDVSQYDAIWELRPDGTMRSTLTPPVGDAPSFADERCPSRWCFILYPSLADITKPIDGVFNASQYMEMGLIWRTIRIMSLRYVHFGKARNLIKKILMFFSILEMHGKCRAICRRRRPRTPTRSSSTIPPTEIPILNPLLAVFSEK